MSEAGWLTNEAETTTGLSAAGGSSIEGFDGSIQFVTGGRAAVTIRESGGHIELPRDFFLLSQRVIDTEGLVCAGFLVITLFVGGLTLRLTDRLDELERLVKK